MGQLSEKGGHNRRKSRCRFRGPNAVRRQAASRRAWNGDGVREFCSADSGGRKDDWRALVLPAIRGDHSTRAPGPQSHPRDIPFQRRVSGACSICGRPSHNSHTRARDSWSAQGTQGVPRTDLKAPLRTFADLDPANTPRSDWGLDALTVFRYVRRRLPGARKPK